MIKRIKLFSLFVIIISFINIFIFKLSRVYDIHFQNNIINNHYNSIDNNISYIYIPRFNIKRIIKSGDEKEILDSFYVLLCEESASLYSDDLIILAGHNVRNVFSKLHEIDIGDSVIIFNGGYDRNFKVISKNILAENDLSMFYDTTKNRLLLITCANKGYRLVVLLEEVL